MRITTLHNNLSGTRLMTLIGTKSNVHSSCQFKYGSERLHVCVAASVAQTMHVPYAYPSVLNHIRTHVSMKRSFRQMLLPRLSNWPNFSRCPSCGTTWRKIIPTAEADKQDSQTLEAQRMLSCSMRVRVQSAVCAVCRTSCKQLQFPRWHPASTRTVSWRYLLVDELIFVLSLLLWSFGMTHTFNQNT